MTMFANLSGRDQWNRRGLGLFLALSALALALSLRLVPGAGDRVWLLPLIVLALVPAALPGRGRVLAGMGLSILAAWLILPVTGGVEGMVTALLLAATALLLGGIAEETRGAPAARLAERLDRRWRANATGEMTAIFAHELTQPLTAATAYLQAGQTELKRSGATVPTFELARAQLLRAGQVIGELRGRLIPKAGAHRPERVSQLIGALRPIINTLGAAAGVSVIIRVDARDDRVLADGIQIQQAMLNLVRNAITSVAGRSERTVIIRGRSIFIDQYEIAVEDTGPGITPEAWNLTLHPAMSKALDGHGFGLPATRTILRNHRSDLAVRPSPSGGADVYFSLARVAESGAQA
ncbi:ATP-binding protein [uncultured Brevundimonas sp.]|uniref:sensor histidine kinase n=1 Tax=uncultured Brevundimonas sp. TaxID=213418 RepID=UPI0030EB3C2E